MPRILMYIMYVVYVILKIGTDHYDDTPRHRTDPEPA